VRKGRAPSRRARHRLRRTSRWPSAQLRRAACRAPRRCQRSSGRRRAPRPGATRRPTSLRRRSPRTRRRTRLRSADDGQRGAVGEQPIEAAGWWITRRPTISIATAARVPANRGADAPPPLPRAGASRRRRRASPKTRASMAAVATQPAPNLSARTRTIPSWRFTPSGPAARTSTVSSRAEGGSARRSRAPCAARSPTRRAPRATAPSAPRARRACTRACPRAACRR
jgi:hypothetical protein